MKKSKILMPVLATIGTTAVIAPVACLTSCALKKLDMEMKNLGENEFGTGNQKSKIAKNATIRLTINLEKEYKISKMSFSFITGGGSSVPISGTAIVGSIAEKDSEIGEQITLELNPQNSNEYIADWTNSPRTLGSTKCIRLFFNTDFKVESNWQGWMKFTTTN